jgi:hypothetical protein
MVMVLAGPGSKNGYAGEGQKQFTGTDWALRRTFSSLADIGTSMRHKLCGCSEIRRAGGNLCTWAVTTQQGTRRAITGDGKPRKEKKDER